MFDPYCEWLGITDERRPPTLYQLLGISPGETHPQVIDHSANRQMMRVQPFLRGPQESDAKRILEELKLARTTLLDPVRRAAYDAIFGVKKPTPAPPPPPPVLVPVPAGPPTAIPWYQDFAGNAPPPILMPAAPQPAMSIPPPTLLRPPAPQPLAYGPPVPVPILQQNMPIPVAPPPAHNFLTAPDSVADMHPSVSDGSLPSADAAFKPSRAGGRGPSPVVFVMAAVTFGLIGAVIYFVMTPSGKTEKDKNVAQREDEPEREREKERPKTKGDSPAVKHKLPPNPREFAPRKTPAKSKPVDAPPPPPKADDSFKEARIFRAHEGIPRAVAISPDSKQLLTAADDFSVLTWAPGVEKPSRRYLLKTPAMGAAYFPNGKNALFTDGGSAFMIDLSTNKIVHEYVNAVAGTLALALTPDGKHFLTGCTDGALRWWDVTVNQQPEHALETGKDNAADCVAIARDSKTAVAGYRDGSVLIWDAAANRKLKELKGHKGASVAGVGFSPDGKRAVSVGTDKVGRVWDVSSGLELFVLKGHEDIPYCAAYTPDGAIILTAGRDSTIRSWDAISGEPLRWMHKATEKVESLAIDPQNRFLIAGLADGGIQLLMLPAVRPDSPDPLLVVKAPPAERLPLPSDSLVESAAQTIRERYKADYALTEVEHKLALVDKLLARARFAPEDNTARFALFQEAKDQALKAGRADEALRVLDFRSKWYETDELTDKTALLRASVQSTPTVPQTSINAAIALVEQAEKEARPDIVDEMMTQQELFAQSAGEDAVNKRIVAAKKRWVDSAKEREVLTKTISALDKDPDDKEANLNFGKRVCFLIGDWPRGLAHFEKSGDDTLVGLAKKDKANPMDGKIQSELGNAWLAYADKVEDEFKAGVRMHARYWLAKAEKSDLPNEVKIKVAEKRLAVDKLIPTDGTGYRPGEAVTRASFNTLRSIVAAESQWVTGPGAEFTKDGAIILKADGGFRSRFKPQDKWKVSFEVIPDGRELKIQVCGAEISFKQPATTVTVPLVVQRKSNKLSYFVGPNGAETTIDLAGAKLEPTLIAVKVVGPAEKDVMQVKNIIVSGVVKPSE